MTSINKHALSTVLSIGILITGFPGPIFGNEAPEHEMPKVNINTASSSELMYLPGVGPKTANAIIEYRKRRPFTKTAHIIRIRGIGRKTFRKLRPYIVVSGETTARGKIRSKKKEARQD